MALTLTNLEIAPVRGNAALLPNQPIIQGAIISASEEATLVPGDVVTLATGGAAGTIVVKKAAVTDTPCGVVVGNPIKTGFVAGDMVSYFPVNSYVYMESSAASIARGSKLQFNADGKVAATTTATSAFVGIALTAAEATGDLVIMQVAPEAAASST